MSRKSKISDRQRLAAVKRHVEEGVSIASLANELGIGWTAVDLWVKGYKTMGESYFTSKTNRSYPMEMKKQAVADYMESGDMEAVCRKYHIISSNQLLLWTAKTRCGLPLRSTGMRSLGDTSVSRRTTLEERVDIAKYGLDGHSIVETAQKFKVSYQQAQSYVVKFRDKGADGLIDRRGRKRKAVEITE